MFLYSGESLLFIKTLAAEFIVGLDALIAVDLSPLLFYKYRPLEGNAFSTAPVRRSNVFHR